MNTLADLLAQIPVQEEEKRFVDKSLQLSALITAAMQRQGLTQKSLAGLLGKKESEVSRWLSGLHNFTLKTLTRLEAVLGEDLVLAFRDQAALPAAVVPAKAEWANSKYEWQTVQSSKPGNRTATPEEIHSLMQAA